MGNIAYTVSEAIRAMGPERILEVALISCLFGVLIWSCRDNARALAELMGVMGFTACVGVIAWRQAVSP